MIKKMSFSGCTQAQGIDQCCVTLTTPFQKKNVSLENEKKVCMFV